MSDKKKWPLEQAKAVAVELLSYLHGFCERAQIAGSIRRGKSLVGDIEILYIPKMEMRKTDMFSAHEVDLAEIKEGNTLLETFAKRVSDAITAVSYTHLPGPPNPRRFSPGRTGQARHRPGQTALRKVPVSYTHLDVYKRQAP